MPFDKLNAIGIGCHLVPTSNGLVLVQSRSTAPIRQDGIYSGKGLFTVTRSSGRKDIVTKRSEIEGATSENEALIINLPFGFSMLVYWEYSDDGGTTYYPSGPHKPYFGTSTWADGGGVDSLGSNTAIDGLPDVSVSPFRLLSDFPPDPLLDIDGFNGFLGSDYVYRILEAKFFFGTPISGPSFAPIIGGTWQIAFDERENDGGIPSSTINATHVIGPFSMTGMEDFSDDTTWPLVSSSLSWTRLTTDDTLFFNGLRIERLT